MIRPLVSLISPVYQSAPYLDAFLDCVRDQTWRPLEFIIADDGSIDRSVDIIRDRIPGLQASGIDVTLLQLEHQGQAGAVNAALKHVAGKYLTWCDP
ncbi:MAG: glycosyltransferase family 2 protein, partial [Parasporobacterium sp.]|nr:glycosyltransferase family 2 protein [Parasporobacterium sp.]